MFALQGRCSSLSDLLSLRTSLRQQEFMLQAALSDVQKELRSWARHRQSHESRGDRVPRELCIVWDELGERERELAMDVIQVRAALRETILEIQQRIKQPRGAAG